MAEAGLGKVRLGVTGGRRSLRRILGGLDAGLPRSEHWEKEQPVTASG